VLDLGCGNGVPTARDLATRFQVTGVDISARQIEKARTAVPSAGFIVGDMTTVAFPPGSFDAIVALYSMIHVRLAELPDLLARVHDWLRPAGRLLITLGTVDGEGLESDWLGVPMFFAGQTPPANLAMLRAAGFTVEAEAIETTAEPEGNVRFHWIRARRPG
jgi:cyclopropane fatty-acyl-phospholipid synthase-like methyltransferase